MARFMTWKIMQSNIIPKNSKQTHFYILWLILYRTFCFGLDENTYCQNASNWNIMPHWLLYTSLRCLEKQLIFVGMVCYI